MGNIKFADCYDARDQKLIQEIDCPNCHEPGGIEVFIKDGLTVGDSQCVECGFVIPEGMDLHKEYV